MKEPGRIAQLLSLGEGDRVEFKTGVRNKTVLGQVVCGFLNSSGGFVVCGVAEDGKSVGVASPDEAATAIEALLMDGLTPKALVSVEVQVVEGKSLLVIEVPAGQDLPYAFQNAIYVREQGQTRLADVATIRDLVLRKQIAPERWERRFSFADIEADLDADELRATREDVTRTRGDVLRAGQEPARLLEELSVAKYGRLTHAGDVLFCRNPAARLPQVRVRAACYSGHKDEAKFRDQKAYQGPLVSVLEEVYAFVVRNTPNTSTFSPASLRRKDEPLYPAEAVREALVNAFAHRDYSSPSGGITVGVFPDRLEIWNSGGLPEGVTVEKLAQGQLSVLRNPDIAHVLYLRGLMERLGRGSVLILNACQKHGLPKPVWTSDERSGVRLTFFAPHVTPQDTPQDTPQVTPQVERLLAVVRGTMSREELMAGMGVSDRKHFMAAYLGPALELGLVEMTLPSKPTSGKQRYRLTPLGQQFKRP